MLPAAKTVLLDFTRSLSAGITLAWVTARKVLTNLYILNTSKSDLPLLYEGDYPNIYPQAYREYLDRLGFMFGVTRLPGEEDEGYRVRILFALRQSTTKEGIAEALRMLFASAMMEVNVEVRESFKDAFDGVSTTFDTPMRSPKGTLLYGITIIISPVTHDLSSVTRPGEEAPVTLPTNLFFHRVKNNNYMSLLRMFQVSSFTELLTSTVASGIKINRVVFREPSAGGSKVP